MFAGGYIRGPWWWFRDDDHKKVRRCFVIAWGHVVRLPEETMKDTRCVRFAIKTGRGPRGGKDQYGRPDDHNEKHLRCEAYGESVVSTVMRAMERKDVVLCAGQWKEDLSQTKKGPKWTYALRVNVIIPMGLIGFLLDLYSTPEIVSAVERYRDGPPDDFESDEEINI